MMAVLEECLELIPKHYDTPVDLAQLPPDDPPVYETLRKADTVGMFQVESRAQMASLPRNAPKKFYDLVVQVAIIRPGPIAGSAMMHPRYVRRRQGKELVRYAHPLARTDPETTLGVPLPEEQLLRMAMVAATHTGGEAEDLRRALGFWHSEERMKKIEAAGKRKDRERLPSGNSRKKSLRKSVPSPVMIFPNRTRRVSLSIAHASAYLKEYYSAAFTAALLNSQPMGFYSPAVLIQDARLHGLRVRPIDVLQSEWNCTIEHVLRNEKRTSRVCASGSCMSVECDRPYRRSYESER